MLSAVSRGVVPLPSGRRLSDGTKVLILPVEWLEGLAEAPGAAKKSSGVKHKFASDALIGCHEGDGVSATNATVRERLRRKAAKLS